MAYEVYTMTDKDKRDRLYEDFRKSGDAKERLAVKFSGQETTGKTDDKGRMTYVTTYSVAHPTLEGVPPRHGSKRYPRLFPGRKKGA